MPNLLSLKRELAPIPYAVSALILLMAPHMFVAAFHYFRGLLLVPDYTFWLLPWRSLGSLEAVPELIQLLALAFATIVAWALVSLSFQRANWAKRAHPLAAFAMVPGLQMVIVPMLMVMPKNDDEETVIQIPVGPNYANMILGIFSGAAIIVLAVGISVIALGSYGWGLFVMTPFIVGVTTAFIVNRNETATLNQTSMTVFAAAALGCVALIALALEGIICLILAAPLGAVFAFAGGLLGRYLALAPGKKNGRAYGVAFLPLVFVIDAALPPQVAINHRSSVEIAAGTADVWEILTGARKLNAKPGLVELAGLAFPTQQRFKGQGIGAERIGTFSTGAAVERVTEWEEERLLTFAVDKQPPAMSELSPYEHVHAPHLNGYFETDTTSFILDPLPGGKTRLTVESTHFLRIDPAPYWEPMARIAIGMNIDRVLRDIGMSAEEMAD